MRNIPTQETATTELSADEFNDIPDELENFITSTGQTLTFADLHQVAKASATYAGGGDFFTDSGTENAKVLTSIGNRRAPHTYSVGQRVRFRPAVSSFDASVTIQVGTLPAIPVSDSMIANGGTPTISNLAANSLLSTGVVTAVYMTTPDGLTPYFYHDRRFSISDLTSGSMALSVGTRSVEFSATFPFGYEAITRLRYTDTTKKNRAQLSEDGLSVSDTDDADKYTNVSKEYIETSVSGSTAARSRSKTIRRVVSAAEWSSTATDGWYTWTGSGVEIDLSSEGVPRGSRLSHATINFKSSSTNYRYSCPCLIQAEIYVGIDYRIANMRCACFESPHNATGDIILELDFDPSRTYP